MNVCCNIAVEWSHSNSAGKIATTGGYVSYSTLGLAGGSGDGAGPEAMLIAAVASCYSVTLSRVLEAVSLPQTEILVCAEGVITGDCGKIQFTSVTVNPTISGTDVLRRAEYKRRRSRRVTSA